VRSTLRDLLRRIWEGALANRGLVATVLVLGMLEAFLTKAPLVLVKFLVDAFGNTDPNARPVPRPEPDGAISKWAREVQTSLEESFHGFATWIQEGFDIDSHRLAVFVSCGVLAAVIGTLGGLATYGMTVLSRYFAAKIVVDLRNGVLEHILKLPMRFFAKRRMGDLISNITNDTAVLTRSFTLISNNAIVDPLSILGNFVLLLIWVPEISWIMLIAVPMLAVPMLRAGRRIHRSSSKSLAAMGDSTESMNQMLSGIRTVKSFQLEEERLREYRVFNGKFLRRVKKMLKAKGFSQGILFAGYQVAFGALLVLLGWLAITRQYTMGDITMALLPLATTYQHVKRVARAYNILCESVGAMEGVESILRVDPDAAHREGGLVLDELRGEVAMEGVSFAYDSEIVVNDLTFHVKPGQTVAFVGPSGAGKSTVVDLIARFHEASVGRVLVDGHDLREIDTQSYRGQMAMVSQSPFLFNTTILENIRYGRRDATDEEIFEAARQANIHEFIVSQPEGYDSIVGEQGTNLSGGQRQRITIARAIVRDPRILVLDEATSALDSESEKAVQSALENLMKGRTSFVIAHRLSTIQSADVILVMENGRLVEQGSHDELIQKSGLYRRMYDLQQL
jgi:ATP-binding cassette, subfamily B, bacterial MsbA